jgi:hypothetical protein
LKSNTARPKGEFMDERIFFAAEESRPRRHIAMYLSQIKDTLSLMPKDQKRILYWRLALFIFSAACLIAVCFRPVLAQQSRSPLPSAVAPVITIEDARQDERIDTLTEFRHNQENYNRQMGDAMKAALDAQDARIEAQNVRIENNEKTIATQNGWIAGGLSLLTIVTGITALTTVKPKLLQR